LGGSRGEKGSPKLNSPRDGAVESGKIGFLTLLKGGPIIGEGHAHSNLKGSDPGTDPGNSGGGLPKTYSYMLLRESHSMAVKMADGNCKEVMISCGLIHTKQQACLTYDSGA